MILALADLVADVATSLRAFADDRSRSWPADQAGASEAAGTGGGGQLCGRRGRHISDKGEHSDGEEGHLV